MKNFSLVLFFIYFFAYCNTYAAQDELQSIAEKHQFIFSHGFGSTSHKAEHYIKSEIIPADTTRFNYQDASWRFEKFGYNIGLNIWDSCCGQADDVERLAQQVADAGSDNVVIFGESRGATVPLRLFHGNSENPAFKKIKALILDSPFDTMHNVIAHRLSQRYLDKVISAETIEQWLSFALWNYKSDFPQPIDMVNSIPKDLPLLFICSQQDTRVPDSSSLALYNKLWNGTHDRDRIHLLWLNEGFHGWLMNGQDHERYRNVIHTFYKKYGIQHNPGYAQAGEETFTTFCNNRIVANID
jgi:pimeloyl-ACP methyl ester carboxylesterase